MSSRRRSTVIDAHVHLFPPEVAADPQAFISQDEWFRETHSRDGIVFPTAATLLASMDDAGVAVSVVAGWPWRDPALCHAHNVYLSEVAAATEGRLVWLGIVNPADRDAAAEVLWCRDHGAHGIGELNADAQGFTWDAPEDTDAVAQACIQRGIPLMAHVSEPVGHVYPGKGTATPERFVRFARAHPQLTIVAAHWGGGLPFYELMPEVAADLKHVWYDSAASTWLYDHRVVAVVADLVGTNRILWGSDYPVLRQKRFLHRFEEHAPGEGLHAMLGTNAMAVYQITPLEEDQ